MSARARIVAVLAVAVVIASGVGLAIAVRSPTEEPPPRGASLRSEAPSEAPREAAGAAPPSAPAMPASGYQKFPKLMGKEAKPFGTDPSQRTPIPAGGFAAWTGREGTWPGEMEAFAAEAKLSLGVALEQHRSTLLEQRTADPNVLAELLGGPPTGNQLAVIGQQASMLHDATATIQVQAREGKLDEAAAIRATRAAADAYRAAYVLGVGITEQQFDELFSPARPLP